MVYNAIAQSAQPILSYNYGAKCTARVRETFRLALTTAILCGAGVLLTWIFSHQIVGMFLDSSYPAYNIAVKGLPLFASGFVFFGINIVSIGYFQSLERDCPAMIITLLRGFALILLCFWILPIIWEAQNLAGCSDVGVIDFLICFGDLLAGESEKLVRIVTFVQRKYKRYGFIYRKILCKILFPLC